MKKYVSHICGNISHTSPFCPHHAFWRCPHLESLSSKTIAKRCNVCSVRQDGKCLSGWSDWMEQASVSLKYTPAASPGPHPPPTRTPAHTISRSMLCHRWFCSTQIWLGTTQGTACWVTSCGEHFQAWTYQAAMMSENRCGLFPHGKTDGN